MAGDPEGLVTFEAAGQTYTAVFGFRAMKAVECHFGTDDEPKPFFQAIVGIMPRLNPEDLGDKKKIAAASVNLRFTDLGTLLRFALLKHHPDLADEDIDDIVDEIGLEQMSVIIGNALAAAMVKEDGTKTTANPPNRRGRSTGSRN